MTTPYSTILSKQYAIDEYVSDQHRHSIDFDTFMKKDSLEGTHVIEPFSSYSLGDIKFDVRRLARTNLQMLHEYAQAVRNGLIIAAIHMWLPDDVNQWNMDHFATVGYNTACEWKINGEIYKFDVNDGVWKSTTSTNTLKYNRDTGLPTGYPGEENAP